MEKMPVLNSLKLKDLPPPPPDKSGWPWTEENQLLPERMLDGSEWPRISIVTPNYNYGRFLEETIRSVLLQGYPNLEYIVIDGGSTDNSVEIIKKYEKWLNYWISENDKGQTYAINKGISQSSGEIFNWLNSDDQLLPEVLSEVAQVWKQKHPHLIVGHALTIEVPSGNVLHYWQPKPPRCPFDLIKHGQFGLGMAQPSTFLSLELVREMGCVREDLNYAFDFAFYLKVITELRSCLKTEIVPITFSRCFSHPDAKTFDMYLCFKETREVFQKMLPEFHWFEQIQVSWHIRQLKTQDNVNQVTKNFNRPLGPLLSLLLRHPYSILSRFFWGAVRREIFKIIT